MSRLELSWNSQVLRIEDLGPDGASRGRLHRFGSHRPSSKHSLELIGELTGGIGGPVCTLEADGGATGVRSDSAVLDGDACVVGVGPYLCKLKLPSLELEWSVQVDDATCFGVYLLSEAQGRGFLSHGELEIARVLPEGRVAWRSSGKDIFTGGVELFDDHVIAEDFNGERYRIELKTGRSTLLNK